MPSPADFAEPPASSDHATSDRPAGNPRAMLRRFIAGDRVSVLRELDDFLLRDIGASSDDIWRLHRLRNGERPTLLVG